MADSDVEGVGGFEVVRGVLTAEVGERCESSGRSRNGCGGEEGGGCCGKWADG
jgi:hypothetical protein